nr:PRO0522 [Homo sapiens]
MNDLLDKFYTYKVQILHLALIYFLVFIFLTIHRLLNLLAFCFFWIPQALFKNWTAALFTGNLLLARDRNLFTVVLLVPGPYNELCMKACAACCLESLRSWSFSLTAK